MNDVVEALRRMKKNLGMYERPSLRGRPPKASDQFDARFPALRDWAQSSVVTELPELTDDTIRIRRLAWSTASFPDLAKLNERLAENGMGIRAALRFPAGLLEEAGIPGELMTISSEVPTDTIIMMLKKAGHWPEPEEGAARSRGMPSEDVVPDMALALQRAGGDFRFIIDGPGESTRVTRHFETVRKGAHFGGNLPLVEAPSAELLHELQTPGLRKTKRLSDSEIMTAFGYDPEAVTGGDAAQAASIRKLSLMLERIGMDIRIAIADPAFGWVVADKLNRVSTYSRLATSIGGSGQKAIEKALADPGKFGLKEIRKAFTSAGVVMRFVLCGPEKGHEEVFDGGAIASDRTLQLINRRDIMKRKASGEEVSHNSEDLELEDPEESLFEADTAEARQSDEDPEP